MNSSKTTEQINQKSINIDTQNIIEILEIFNLEDYSVIEAVKSVFPDLEKLIIEIVDIIFNMILVAVPAFILVEPEIISGPTTTLIL